MPTIGAKLREFRESYGWSQVLLAKASSQKVESIVLWEADERVLPFDAMQAICSAFGVPLTAFDGCDAAHEKTIAVKRRRSKRRVRISQLHEAGKPQTKYSRCLRAKASGAANQMSTQP